MSNALYKFTNITYQPGTAGVPATPGRPYIPARTVYQSTLVCGLEPAVPGRWEYVQTGYSISRVWVPTNPPMPAGTPTVYVCHTELVPTIIPAQSAIAPTPAIPGTEASLRADYNIGWNSSSRSISFFRNDGYIEFDVPPGTVGAVVGLNERDEVSSYVDIDHAFYVSRDVARVYERGVERAYLGATDNGRYRITRLSGTVRYYVDDVLVYTSALPSSQPAFMDASLYVGGDLVDNPVLGDLAQINLTLQPAQVRGGTVAYASAQMTTRPLLMLGGVTSTTSPSINQLMQDFANGLINEGQLRFLAGLSARATLTLGPAAAYGGDTPTASASLTLEPITVTSDSGLTAPPYAVASMVIAYPQVAATGLAGGTGTGDLELAPLTLLGSNFAYGSARLTLEPAVAYAYALEGPTDATMGSFGSVGATMSGAYVVALVMNADMTIDAAFLAQLSVTADMADQLTVDAALAAIVSQMSAAMSTPLGVSVVAPPLEGDGQVWVLNMDSAAVSTYENYEFNSFAKFGGAVFGCKTDGVFTLDGDTDDGALIRASINFGNLDLGSKAHKRPQHAYIGVSSTGEMYVRVTVDGRAYTYRARSSSENMRTQRVDFGKGLKANYIQFELYNQDGGDFEFDDIEFHYVEMSRRI